MKSIIATIGLSTVSLSLMAAADGPPVFTCPSGADWLGWSLTATPYAETPIFAGNKNTKVAAVCNCSQQTAEIDGGVWIVTMQADQLKAKVHGRALVSTPPPPIQPGPGDDVYYLAASACSIVGPGSVILRTADHRAVKWGVWKIQ